MSYPEVSNWQVADGDFFTESETRSASRVAVPGGSVVKELFGSEDPVGKTIRVRNMPFEVIGVFDPR